MGRTLRAGVIGAGVFGGYHARQYANRSAVAFAGVFDPDAAAGQALIAAVGGQAFESLEALLAEADVISITSPAMFHAEQGLAAVAAGLHVSVEKPIATDVRAAERLAIAAGRAGVVLANGHQERVVFQAMGLL
ncbi:MAG: Gfo/Idh/MocA family protein, partial [Phenylobacterium sp.]